MVQVFDSREKAKKATKNVNDYLAEQQMYFNVEVVEASGKYIVAIVNCY